MKEYIEREALLEKSYWHGKLPDFDNPYPNGVEAVDVCDIDAIPAADVVEHKHGEWIETEDDEIVCSACGIRIPEMYSNADSIIKSECRFCHYCGAIMVNEHEE